MYRVRRRFVVFVVVCVALLGGAMTYVFLPKPELYHAKPLSRAYFDSQQQLLKLELADDEQYRLNLPLNEVPAKLQQAVVLYEDQEFYQHNGVDFVALARAFWQTYILQQRRIGASTITMQVARLRFDINSSSISGKLEQVFRAMQLAKHYSKDEILQAYFNLAPYGGNIEGIGAASLIYFNKLPAELNFAEILTLAVVPQNPNKRSPAKWPKSGAVNDATKQARDILFARWREYYPQDGDQESIINLPLVAKAKRDLPNIAPHFTQMLGARAASNDASIHTTLNNDLQKKLERSLQAYVRNNASKGIHNAAALLLNARTMQVEAMIGSAAFDNHDIQGQVNGTLAKRSPGSALKPFVYALALDAGLIHPRTMLKDLPRRFAAFSPENYGRGFLGPVSATDALVKSRNVPAVGLQADLVAAKQHNSAVIDLYQLLQQGQVSALQAPEFYGLALSLGGMEISMVELAQLYAMLVNGGEFRKASLLAGVNKQQVSDSYTRLLSPEASFLVLNMLKENPPPSSHNSAQQQPNAHPIAWKTGTSWAFRDAWAVGTKGDYVLATWIGNFNGRGNHNFVGRTAAGPLLFTLFDAIQAQVDSTLDNEYQLVKADSLNLQQVEVCAATGDLYTRDCPQKTSTWFIPGVSPIKNSNVYRRVLIDKQTGLRRCDRDLNKGRWQVFEFWPSDYQRLFEQAGIFKRKAPEFMPNCNINIAQAQAKRTLQITSPTEALEYVVSASNTAEIPLMATADAEVSNLHWFVDNTYLHHQKGSQQQPYIWHAHPGAYTLHVSDDNGQASRVKVRVVSK